MINEKKIFKVLFIKAKIKFWFTTNDKNSKIQMKNNLKCEKTNRTSFNFAQALAK